MTKCELPGADAVHAASSEAIGHDVLAISAVTGAGLDSLLHHIRANSTSEQSRSGIREKFRC